MDDGTPLRNCPACASANATVQKTYSPSPWLVAECASCGFVYLRNPPGYEALEEDFAWEKTYEAKKVSSRGSTFISPLARQVRNGLGMYRDKTQSFRRWFNDGNVLDIGCGSGGRITPLMTPFGIELSKNLQRAADEVMRSRGGYCLFGAGAEAIQKFEPEMFDGIVMFSYLEHETQVMDVLNGAHNALKPSGSVFIRVPNYGSLNRRVIGSNWCGLRLLAEPVSGDWIMLR